MRIHSRIGTMQALLVLSSLVLAAHLSPARAAAQETRPPGVPTEEASRPRPELATPRETVRTFFRAFRLARETGAQDISSAVETLDLSRLSAAVRPIKGRELAIQLKELLDRTAYVDVEAIPDDLEGPPYLLLSRPQGDVLLARGGDGSWRFSAESVSRIPELYEAARGGDVVDGVQAVDRRLSPSLWLDSWRRRPAHPASSTLGDRPSHPSSTPTGAAQCGRGARCWFGEASRSRTTAPTTEAATTRPPTVGS